MRKQNFLVLASVMGIVGLSFLLATGTIGSKAQADDSYRTTGLTINSYDFDDDGTPESAISAALQTTLTSDTRVKIQTYWRDSGSQTENTGGSAWADREDSNTLWVHWKQPTSEYDSNTTIRVVFTCYDSNGQTFSYERTTTTP